MKRLILLIYLTVLIATIFYFPIFSTDFFSNKYTLEFKNSSDIEIFLKRYKVLNVPFNSEVENNKLFLFSMVKPDNLILRKCNIEIFLKKNVENETAILTIEGEKIELNSSHNKILINDTEIFFDYEKKEIYFKILDGKNILPIDVFTNLYDRNSKQYFSVANLFSNIDLESKVKKIINNFERDVLRGIINGKIVYVVDNETFGESDIPLDLKNLAFIINSFDSKVVKEREKVVKICSNSKSLNDEIKLLSEEFNFGKYFYFYLVLILALIITPFVIKRWLIYKDLLFIFFMFSTIKVLNSYSNFPIIEMDFFVLATILFISIFKTTRLFNKYLIFILAFSIITSFIPFLTKVSVTLILSFLAFGISSLVKKLE